MKLMCLLIQQIFIKTLLCVTIALSAEIQRFWKLRYVSPPHAISGINTYIRTFQVPHLQTQVTGEEASIFIY